MLALDARSSGRKGGALRPVEGEGHGWAGVWQGPLATVPAPHPCTSSLCIGRLCLVEAGWQGHPITPPCSSVCLPGGTSCFLGAPLPCPRGSDCSSRCPARLSPPLLSSSARPGPGPPQAAPPLPWHLPPAQALSCRPRAPQRPLLTVPHPHSLWQEAGSPLPPRQPALPPLLCRLHTGHPSPPLALAPHSTHSRSQRGVLPAARPHPLPAMSSQSPSPGRQALPSRPGLIPRPPASLSSRGHPAAPPRPPETGPSALAPCLACTVPSARPCSLRSPLGTAPAATPAPGPRQDPRVPPLSAPEPRFIAGLPEAPGCSREGTAGPKTRGQWADQPLGPQAGPRAPSSGHRELGTHGRGAPGAPSPALLPQAARTFEGLPEVGEEAPEALLVEVVHLAVIEDLGRDVGLCAKPAARPAVRPGRDPPQAAPCTLASHRGDPWVATYPPAPPPGIQRGLGYLPPHPPPHLRSVPATAQPGVKGALGCGALRENESLDPLGDPPMQDAESFPDP